MKLHEAIIAVLQQKGRAMSFNELADEINKKGLYSRKKDNLPLPANQVSRRVRKPTYAHLFSVSGQMVRLSRGGTTSAAVPSVAAPRKQETSSVVPTCSSDVEQKLMKDFFVSVADLESKKDLDKKDEPDRKNLSVGMLSDIEVARERYRPEKIRLLFVAEAPPSAADRFFYYEDVRSRDYLFLALFQEIMPEREREYMESGRNPSLKEAMLQDFKSLGFFLVDLSPVPVTESVPEDHAEEFMERLNDLVEKGLMDKDVPIVLIKSNVYDCLYGRLCAAGYNVKNVRLPFPSCGQQNNFRRAFAEIKGSILQ